MSERSHLFPRPRGIFAKLLLVFIIIGVVPFTAMALWTYDQARDRMTQAVIEHWLVRLSREVAVEIDQEVQQMRGLVHGWAEDHALARLVAQAHRDSAAGSESERRELRAYLANCLKTRGDIDLILVVARDGLILSDSLNQRDGPATAPLTGRNLADLILPQEGTKDCEALASECRWIKGAFSLKTGAQPLSARDWHLSHLLALARGKTLSPGERPEKTAAYSVGFAGALSEPGKSAAIGTIAVLFNLSPIQRVIDSVTERFVEQKESGATGKTGRYRTGYPFLFAADADTVIAHKYQQNLGKRLEEDFGKGVFRRKILAAPYGSHRYDYPKRNPKIAGFAHCAGPDRQGFGWVVGVGIDSQDIYADVISLRNFLLVWAMVVTVLVILVAFVLSHRLTKPLLRLADHTRLVASGNLDARVEIDTGDEITTLAEAFNTMASRLKETNRKLIKAEKDAAWREMARQVAHEIKNPLTPIMLSAQQVEQARRDRHPLYDEIVEESMASIIDQCRSLKQIASDFMAYARLGGGRKEKEKVSELLQSAAAPYSALDATCGIKLEIENQLPEDFSIFVVPGDIKRVLINLINNAIQAIGESEGHVRILAREERAEGGPFLRISVQDDGSGIPPEHREQLFEPSFSSRTGGTGLGLAISRKIIEEHGGHIEVSSQLDEGTTMSVVLPLAPNPE